MPEPPTPRTRLAAGLFMAALGAWVSLLALGVLPMDPEALHVPRWVFLMCGLVFVAGGGALLSEPMPALRDAFVATLLLTFALAGAWVAFFSDSEAFSGGLPFLPDIVNVILARSLFGLGAIGLGGSFVYVALRILRGQSIDGDRNG